MAAVLRQLVALIGAILAIYVALLLATLVAYPVNPDEPMIDSGRLGATLYSTEPKYVFMDRQAFAKPKERFVFVGASNTAVGFRPVEVAPLVPGAEIDNVAVGGSNLTQMAQIVDLVSQMQGPEARQKTTFVIGLWYGLFEQNADKWRGDDRVQGDTDIDIERYRYGFYRRSSQGPVQVLPPEHLALGLLVIHPYLVLDKLVRASSERARELIHGKAPARTAAERNATVLSEQDKATDLAYWANQIKTGPVLPDEQFEVLDTLIRRILANGSRVVVVNLPIPKWHAQRSPFEANYSERVRAMMQGLRQTPGVSYVDLSAHDNELDFSDEVHPKPRVTPDWAKEIAPVLRGLLDRPMAWEKP